MGAQTACMFRIAWRVNDRHILLACLCITLPQLPLRQLIAEGGQEPVHGRMSWLIMYCSPPRGGAQALTSICCTP